MTHRYVTRMDYARSHGWWVRIYLSGACLSKLFSDGVHGGRLAALRRALDWRDAKLLDHGLSIPAPGRYRTRGVDRPHGGKRRNNTGCSGVQYVRKKCWTRHGGQLYGPYWKEDYVVSFQSQRVAQRTSVSIKKYGKRFAFLRALEIRAKGLRAARKHEGKY